MGQDRSSKGYILFRFVIERQTEIYRCVRLDARHQIQRAPRPEVKQECGVERLRLSSPVGVESHLSGQA